MVEYPSGPFQTTQPGAQVIDSATLTNFRCFKSTSISNLKRVNIIVGRNASGKTALLEALFLASGQSPELALRIKGWRGMAAIVLSDQRVAYEALWKDLFFGFDQTKEISISLNSGADLVRALTISYNPEPEQIPIEIVSGSKESAAFFPVTFTWDDRTGNSFGTQPVIRGATITANVRSKSKSPLIALPVAFYSSSAVPSQDENAQYFSELSIRHAEKPIVDFMKQEFPFVEDLSVESSARTPTIFASVRGLEEKIPVNLLSTGVTKIMSVVLGMSNQQGGMVLIDELENGLYWDRLPSIWRALVRFSKQYNVQVFASTHSQECLEAAASAADENEDEFSLLRVEKANGHSIVRQFSGTSLRASMDVEAEVR